MRRGTTAVASWLIGSCVGCGVGALKPSDNARLLPGTANAAETSVNGVRLVSEANAWRGEGEIDMVLTPLRLRVTNQAAAPIDVRYADIALVARGGARYHALPLQRIRGAAPAPGVAHSTMFRPGIDCSDQRWSSYGDHGYPQGRRDASFVSGAPCPYATSFSQLAYERQDLVELPTPEMARLALPESTLASGGSVEGFVYFERVNDDEPAVTLHVRVRAAGSTQEVATLIVPFERAD